MFISPIVLPRGEERGNRRKGMKKIRWVSYWKWGGEVKPVEYRKKTCNGCRFKRFDSGMTAGTGISQRETWTH